LYSPIFFHLVKDKLRIKRDKVSFAKGSFAKLKYKGFVKKLLKEGEEVRFQDLCCTKKHFFLNVLFEVVLK
jgi:hypothetical protein